MDLTEAFPSFDSAIAMLLASLGVSAPIIALLMLIGALKSWLDIGKQTVKGAVYVGVLSQRIGQRLSQMPRAKVATSALITAMVTSVQLLTVFMCYLFGNFIAMYIKHRQPEVQQAIADKSYAVLLPQNIWSITHFDAISGTYTVIAILIIALSYLLVKNAENEELLDSLAKFLAFPATLLGYLAGTSLLVMGLCTALLWFGLWAKSGFSDMTPDGMGVMVFGITQISIILIICLVFRAMCKSALKSSKTTLETWSKDQG